MHRPSSLSEMLSESSSPSPAESESDRAGLYDFIYLDRLRIASYYSQLTNRGITTGMSTTEGVLRSTTRTGVAGVQPFVSGSGAVNTTTNESAHRQFDPAILEAIEAIECLDDEGSIAEDLDGAVIGSIIIAHGNLSILDVRLIKEMWNPLAAILGQMNQETVSVSADMTRNERKAAQRATATNGIANQLSSIVEIAKSLPHAIQATLSSKNHDALWSVLELQHFIGSPEALTLKHGAFIDGDWSIIALLDARPDVGTQSDPFADASGNVADMMRGLQEFIRQQFGRPQVAYAVTPLAIYRVIPRNGS